MKFSIKNINKLLLSNDSLDNERAIEIISEQKLISNKILEYILQLEDIYDIVECLFACNFFSKKQLKRLKKFIKKNLYHKDEVFRNELINFAFYWHMDYFWKDCISFIKNPNESSIVIIISIDYIYECMNIDDLPKVKELFEKVINNDNYYQNCQTVAAFYLFRLTHKKKYYNYLKESMLLNNGVNKVVLKNLLKVKYNQAEYFAFYNEMMRWIVLDETEFKTELKKENLLAEK